MKTHVRNLARNVTAGFGRMRATSGPVKAAVVAEQAVAMVAVALAWWRCGPAVGRLVDLGQAPPWRALVVFPVVGIAAALARAWRADEIVRRWHGVLLRRVDERWGSS